MRYWIGVASRDHVKTGVTGGFCQLSHGKASPVRRMSPGDWIIYYSPRSGMHGGDVIQAFTAIGRIRDREPYPFAMDSGFVMTRRDVDFIDSQEVPIRPLIDQLHFIRNKQSWGSAFRFGQIEISEHDFQLIADAMGVSADRQAA